MKTYFTADTHFNCPRLVEATRTHWSDDHDQYVLDCINRTATRRDRLVIVGDFCKGQPYKWRQQIRCRDIWLVLGNHDRPISPYQACFGGDRVKHIYDLKIGLDRHKVAACHFPMIHWNCSHHGSLHVYGHVHGGKEEELDSAFPQRRSIDVGVDNAYSKFGEPIPFEDDWLIDYLTARTGHGIV